MNEPQEREKEKEYVSSHSTSPLTLTPEAISLINRRVRGHTDSYVRIYYANIKG